MANHHQYRRLPGDRWLAGVQEYPEPATAASRHPTLEGLRPVHQEALSRRHNSICRRFHRSDTFFRHNKFIFPFPACVNPARHSFPPRYCQLSRTPHSHTAVKLPASINLLITFPTVASISFHGLPPRRHLCPCTNTNMPATMVAWWLDGFGRTYGSSSILFSPILSTIICTFSTSSCLT